MQFRLQDEVQVLVERLAALLHQSVAIDDPHGNIIAISRHYGDEDGYRLKLLLERAILDEYRTVFDPYVSRLAAGEISSPVHVPARPDMLMVGRIGYAIRDAGRVIAILWCIDRGGELPEQIILDHCAHLGALLAERDNRGAPGQGSHTSQVIEQLLSGAPALHDETALWLAESGTEFYVVATLSEPQAPPVRAELQRVPAVVGAELLSVDCVTYQDGLDIGVYGGQFESADGARETKQRLSDYAAALLHAGKGDRGVSVSGPGKVAGLREHYVSAALGAFMSLQLRGSAYPLDAQQASALIDSVSAPFESVEPAQVEVLKGLLADPEGSTFDTIRAVIRSAGSLGDASASLHIHRTTLHYRLSQITERTGFDVHAPGDMFTLSHVWLRSALARSTLSHLAGERRDGRAAFGWTSGDRNHRPGG